MEQTINKRTSISSLDITETYRLYPTYNKDAKYQLEFYRTKEHPRTPVCALNKNKNNFSYNVGDTVDVRKKIELADGLWLTNVIMNETLQEYSR